jgi:hypothetical protein
MNNLHLSLRNKAMVYNSLEDLVEKGGVRPILQERCDDIFLVAASFEPRSVALTNGLAADYRAVRSFVYVNDDFLATPAADAMRNTIAVLQAKLKLKSDHCQIIKGNWENVVVQVEAIRKAFAEVILDKTPATVTIDCTTFSREALIVCLAMLHSHCPGAQVRAAYVSPEVHGTWLSRGYRKVRSIVGFSGIQQASQPSVLIVLSGFEGDRTLKLIEEYEPSQVLLGFGDPPTIHSFLERNLGEQKLVLGRTDVKEFRFPANSISDCTVALEELIRPLLESCNLVIAPMSTKLSTLAALNVAERHREIQLAYCLPGEYNYSDYSTGTSRIFIENLKDDEKQ